MGRFCKDPRPCGNVKCEMKCRREKGGGAADKRREDRSVVTQAWGRGSIRGAD